MREPPDTWQPMSEPVLLLHPGTMGAALGACLGQAGHLACWVSGDRGPATAARAAAAGLAGYANLEAALSVSGIVISVCPPAAACDVARAVAAAGFRGIYVDANAVSPDTAQAIAAIVAPAGATFVDGGIVGPPPQTAGTTRLYLAGARAADVAERFHGSALEAITLGAEPGTASALKMCYAAWSKGSAALLLHVAALARSAGVEHALFAEWSQSMPGLTGSLADAAQTNAPKAWRFVAEMEEIAATFEQQGLSGAWHRAAAGTYGALGGFRNGSRDATLDSVLAALIEDASRDVT